MVKNILVSGVAVNAGDLLQQVPTVVLVVLVFCFFILVALVLFNESACKRLIRILKAIPGRSDRIQNPKSR